MHRLYVVDQVEGRGTLKPSERARPAGIRDPAVPVIRGPADRERPASRIAAELVLEAREDVIESNAGVVNRVRR